MLHWTPHTSDADVKNANAAPVAYIKSTARQAQMKVFKDRCVHPVLGLVLGVLLATVNAGPPVSEVSVGATNSGDSPWSGDVSIAGLTSTLLGGGADISPVSKAVANTRAVDEAMIHVQTKTKSASESEPLPQPRPKPKPKIKLKSEPEPEPEPEPESNSKPSLKPVIKHKLKSALESTPETSDTPTRKPNQKHKITLDPKPKPEHEPEPGVGHVSAQRHTHKHDTIADPNHRSPPTHLIAKTLNRTHTLNTGVHRQKGRGLGVSRSLPSYMLRRVERTSSLENTHQHKPTNIPSLKRVD